MVTIHQETCTGCALCVKDCVFGNLEMRNGKAAVKGDCIRCGHCVAICPVYAAGIPEYDMADIEVYQREAFTVKPDHFLRAIKFRRSIRFFKPRQVEKDKLRRIIQAGRYTATAVNLQDVRFMVVQDSLPRFKEMIWQGWEKAVRKLSDENNPNADRFNGYLTAYRQDPQQDRLFFNAPVAVILAADVPLDAGLAAANLENMAVAEGLGVLYDGYVIRALAESPEAKEWIQLGDKQPIACLLLGYPDVTYKRTAPRRKADLVWK